MEVEAKPVESSITVMHDHKGEMRGKKGDWLVGSEKGQVEVVKRDDFERDFEPIEELEPEPTTPVVETHLGNADGGYDTTHTDSQE